MPKHYSTPAAAAAAPAAAPATAPTAVPAAAPAAAPETSTIKKGASAVKTVSYVHCTYLKRRKNLLLLFGTVSEEISIHHKIILVMKFNFSLR